MTMMAFLVGRKTINKVQTRIRRRSRSFLTGRMF